jgi:eukaryotic-like serine/threonine-protein kinase
MLSAGVRLGPYEIISAIGAGGMGEVYRARDSRLGREVAIKVLPATLSAFPDRLYRFEQEARAAAALSHPNILAVHDIGTSGDTPFIVSELLVGQTLRERLAAGPIPVRKALAYAIEIARGLTAAHEQAIVHRDLKPENLFITSDDRVKILDFGLAKLVPDRSADESASELATAAPPTELGTVLGTVGYMAPEQVRGLPVDQRADLFAFGAILYELVSGQRAFRRQTPAETMAAILNEHPPPLPGDRTIPPALARIVDRCLEKSPAARFQTASDLAFALDGLSDQSAPERALSPGPRSSLRGREWIAWTIVGLLLLGLAPLAYRHLRELPAVTPSVRFQIPPAVQLAGPSAFSMSPDGRLLAFYGVGSDGSARIWLHSMESLDVRPLLGTEIGISMAAPQPFWSPDGRFLAFQAGDGKLKKIAVSGGPPQALCDLSGVAVGGSWNRAGDIIFGNTAGGLLHVRETGGVCSQMTVFNSSAKEEFHLLPTFLSDGRHFIYLRVAPSEMDVSGVFVGTLDAKPHEQSAQRLMPYEIGIAYAAANDSGSGHLLFLREGTVMAQPFDERRLALEGTPAPVAERVGSFRDAAFFAVSASGVLVFREANMDSQVVVVDRTGTVSSRAWEPGGFRGAALSPDESRAVVSRTNPQDAAKADLWLLDLSSGSRVTRFTLGGGKAEYPVWSRNGQRVAYTLNNNVVYQKLTNGEGDEKELLRVNSAGSAWATSWSPDGRFLLYVMIDSPKSISDIWVLPLDGRKGVPFVQTRFIEDQAQFSPDGRWVAYVSDQSGEAEVYLRAFTSDFSGGSASSGGALMISAAGGSAPRWRGDGKELVYLAPDGKLMAVEITPGAERRAATPAPLFQTPPGTIVGDMAADGKRFLLVTPVGSASAPFTVVLNWMEALKQRVPAP